MSEEITENKKEFDPNEHITQLKSKSGNQDYLEVKWRLVWFRSKYPHGRIHSEEREIDLDREVEAEAWVWNAEKRRNEKTIKQAKGYARFYAIAEDGEGGIGTGTKAENAATFPDFVEKAETGAIGRALAALGFGTQFAADMAEGHRLADAPVDSQNNGHQAPAGNGSNGARSSTPPPAGASNGHDPDAPASAQQIGSIRKLCTHLGKQEPEKLESYTYQDAAATLRLFTDEYKSRQATRK